jgi:hypothetical protein
MKFLRLLAVFLATAPAFAQTPQLDAVLDLRERPALPGHDAGDRQESSLAAVLDRAGAYVVEFQRRLSGVVAEEIYVQHVRMPVGTRTTSASGMLPTHRELKSDLLLVKPAGVDRWLQFRDVFEVDGKPVRDRNERLMQLFVKPSSSSAEQADRIVSESARYNIGGLLRTVNAPVLALVILDPVNQPRFSFKRVDRFEPLLGHWTGAPLDSIWILEYREVQKRTLIRTTNNRDLPARGRFWIEAATGRVFASELVAEDPLIQGIIDVEYQMEPSIGLLVPVEMRERYEIRREGSRVDGNAAYSRFRQFQVKVDEKLAPIK